MIARKSPRALRASASSLPRAEAPASAVRWSGVAEIGGPCRSVSDERPSHVDPGHRKAGSEHRILHRHRQLSRISSEGFPVLASAERVKASFFMRHGHSVAQAIFGSHGQKGSFRPTPLKQKTPPNFGWSSPSRTAHQHQQRTNVRYPPLKTIRRHRSKRRMSAFTKRRFTRHNQRPKSNV